MALKIRIEVPVLLIFFASLLSDSVTTNLIIYRTCYIVLNYNETDCAMLGKNYSNTAIADLEKKVQPVATVILMTTSFVQAFIPTIICFFLGPWSDIYGRKPILLSTIAGSVMTYLIYTIISAIPHLSPWSFLLVLIPNCFCGGFTSFFTAVVCFVTDVTNEQERGLRMALLEGTVSLGILLGTSCSSYLLNSCGYVILYSICCGCAILAWLFTLIFISESVENPKTEGKIRNLFRLSLIKMALKTLFKRRENYERALLFTIIALMAMSVVAIFGNSGVIFLYLREQFLWTLQKYTLYSSITSTSIIIGGILGVYILHRLLRFKETTVILYSLILAFISLFLQGFADTNWKLYIAGSIKFLNGAIGPMVRCLLSKLVPAADAGKIFAALTSLETIGALTGSMLFTYIYNCTMSTRPATFSFIISGIYVFNIFLLIGVIGIKRYQSQLIYRQLDVTS